MDLQKKRRIHIFPFTLSSVCLHTLWGSSPWETGELNRNGCPSCYRCCCFTTVNFPVIWLNVSFKGWRLNQAPKYRWCVTVLVFSDPFFPLSFLVNSWFPGTLDAFFQALFLSSLLLFWLCVYHGIRVQVASRLRAFTFFKKKFQYFLSCTTYFPVPQGERKCLTFYLPKLIIVGLLWLSAVTLGIWQT